MLARAALLWGSLIGCAATACSSAHPAQPSHAGRESGAQPAAHYAVEIRADGSLLVDITVRDGAFRELTIEPDAEPFVTAVEVAGDGGKREQIARIDWPLRLEACGAACSIRYHFDWAGAARALRNPQFGAALGGGFVAPPTTWLMRPSKPRDSAFTLSVTTPPGWLFASGLNQTEDGTFRASLSDLPQAPYSAFGPFARTRLNAGEATLELVRVGPEPAVGDRALEAWVSGSAAAIAAVLGRFPAEKTLVLVLVAGGQSITQGSALGNGGASIIVHVGADAAPGDFASDWILTHEMVHVSMPGLAAKHSWMEEGMATFLEPVARAKSGTLAADQVWAEWYYAMWKGQPLRGDEGLDGTGSWGRLYWGGAAFWLTAQLAIAETTGGTKGVADCLRRVNAEGGTIASRWSVDRFLAACDRGIGAPVVEPLYRTVADRAVDFDLDGMFQKLGVRKAKRGVELDDDAQAAGFRRSMTAPAAANGQRRFSR